MPDHMIQCMHFEVRGLVIHLILQTAGGIVWLLPFDFQLGVWMAASYLILVGCCMDGILFAKLLLGRQR